VLHPQGAQESHQGHPIARQGEGAGEGEVAAAVLIDGQVTQRLFPDSLGDLPVIRL
jgi:hypothetical protein